MNKAERFVYNRILKEGYNKMEIKHSFLKSPDFVIPKDKREIEVKLLGNNKTISFTYNQKNLKNSCEIWILKFDQKKFILVTKISFGKLKELYKNNLLKFRVYFNKKRTMTINEEIIKEIDKILEFENEENSLGRTRKGTLLWMVKIYWEFQKLIKGKVN